MPEELAEFAYDDTPLPIGERQTISQPYVALTLDVLEVRGGERVLDVGTGSGYAAALVSASRARSTPSSGSRRWPRPPLPERAPNEAFDPDLEWDRDGQYFHYLTKWMHALDQVARVTGDARFNLWARELAEASHRAFLVGPPGARRMVWKLSVDLSRPLVPSMGQHHPLDGYVACKKLEATGVALAPGAGPGLAASRALQDGRSAGWGRRPAP